MVFRGEDIMTDERLRIAASKVEDAMLRQYDQYAIVAHDPQFSRRFERKMKRLLWRLNHPRLYRSMRRIAFMLPSMIVGGSLWLLFSHSSQQNIREREMCLWKSL